MGVAAHVRRRGIHVFPYLDNWLVRGRSGEQVLSYVQFTLDLFDQLGVIFSKTKLTLTSTQKNQVIWHPSRFCEFKGLSRTQAISDNSVPLFGSLVSFFNRSLCMREVTKTWLCALLWVSMQDCVIIIFRHD